MKRFAWLLKAYLAVGILIIALVAGFVLWRIPPHAVAAGSGPIAGVAMSGGAYVTALGFAAAGGVAWRGLDLLVAGRGFTRAGANCLAHLRSACLVMQLGIVMGLPGLYQIADSGDAPGLLVIGLLVLAAPVAAWLGLTVMHRAWPTAA